VKNNGKGFEDVIGRCIAQYEFRNVLTARKCDPPTVFVRGHVVLKANPFPDFVGSWRERGGKMVMIEAKSTEEPFLKIAQDGGLRVNQIEPMERWERFGAATFVLWGHAGEMYLIPHFVIAKRLSAGGVKRMKPGEDGVYRCAPAVGLLHDFASVMRAIW